jgi:RHS repeat-associated protein
VSQNGASGDTARVRTFAYDGLSRLTNACNPESIANGSSCSTSGPWSAAYTYDANGNVKKRTDARAIVTSYTYDAMNRVTAKSYTNDPANTPALTYGYDTEYPWQIAQDEDNPVGHLNSIMATLGATNLTTWTSGDYDQRGNLLGYTNCVGSNAQSCPGYGVGTVYGYNLAEQPAVVVESAGGPSSGTVDNIFYSYDNTGRLNSISTELTVDASGSTLTSTDFSGLTYYPGGAVETANLGIDPTSQIPAITLSRTYDNRGRITGEIDNSSTGQSAYNYSVSYDGNSNVTGYNDSVEGSWTASYDAVHRLVKSTGTMNGVAATFQQTYDHFGNRNVEYLTYNGVQSQPTPYLNFTTGNNRAASSTYDNAGNLLSDGTNNYLYDAENRVCAVKQLTSGDLIGYVYAANGPRLGKGNLTSFSCDVTKNGLLTANGLALTNAYVAGPQGERLEETDANFNMLHYNVFWEGKLLGTFTGTTYAQSNWHFALNDWVGTKRELTLSTGAPCTSLSGGPFGDYASQTGSCSNPSGELFTSKVRDTESGLDDFLARHYSSNWGRFMSPDPGWYFQADVRNPQSWNQYSYVLNNPLINTDPDGRECVWDDGSYDSADDKQTGNAEGCSSQGGTYVPPANFENSLLTNGQMSNVQRGDWSPDANSTIASSWVNNTPDVTASPMQNGDLTSNMSMNDFISMMQQSNFYLSDMDQALANHHLSAHSGIQMRQDKEGCNLHVNIDRNSGQNGQPVKGDFHYDVLNPNPNSYPTDSLITGRFMLLKQWWISG